jgi:DNA polymerase-3 subunit beta
MQLTVLQENLVKGISLATRFVNSRAQLPALANIALSAQKTKLSIFATNLEMSIALAIGAKVEKEGAITIPARVIGDLIGSLKPGTITLSTKGEQVSLEVDGFSSTISGINAADFPKVPQTVSKKAVKISAAELIKALNKILFSVSIDETRPVLTGVLIFFDKQDLVLVATDGFRLSQKKIHFGQKLDLPKAILPKNVLTEITRVFAENEGELWVDLRENDNQMVIAQEDIFVSSRIIDGEFPDFERIIPKESQIKVSVDKEELLRAVKAAAVFARDAANIVKFVVNKGKVSVLSESAATGKQETKIEAKVEGLTEKLEVNYNYRFLLEVLNVIEDNFVEIELTNDASPGVFKDPKDPSFLHLIMPVKMS